MQPRATLQDRFNNELQGFLLSLNISIETPILNDVMQSLSGVMFDDVNNNYGFSVSSYRNDEKSLSYSYPEILIDDFLKLADYLEIPKNERKMSNSVKVSEKTVLEKVLPAFKKYVQEEQQKKSDFFTNYVLASRPILEGTAIGQIENAIKSLQEETDKLNDQSEFAIKMAIIRKVFEIQGTLTSVKKNPNYYRLLTDLKNEFNQMFETHEQEINKHAELARKCKMLIQGITLFEKYNLCESKIACEKFFEEGREFTDKLEVSMKHCDIIERTLLNLADVKAKPADCKIKPGSDSSRITIKFQGITKQECEQVISYLKSMGDSTAKEGYGDKHWNRYRPTDVMESASLKSMAAFSLSERPQRFAVQPTKIIPSFSIECDALTFYNVIYPQMKKSIVSTNESNPAALNEFRFAALKWRIIKSQQEFISDVSEKSDELSLKNAMINDFVEFSSKFLSELAVSDISNISALAQTAQHYLTKVTELQSSVKSEAGDVIVNKMDKLIKLILDMQLKTGSALQIDKTQKVEEGYSTNNSAMMFNGNKTNNNLEPSLKVEELGRERQFGLNG